MSDFASDMATFGDDESTIVVPASEESSDGLRDEWRDDSTNIPSDVPSDESSYGSSDESSSEASSESSDELSSEWPQDGLADPQFLVFHTRYSQHLGPAIPMIPAPPMTFPGNGSSMWTYDDPSIYPDAYALDNHHYDHHQDHNGAPWSCASPPSPTDDTDTDVDTDISTCSCLACQHHTSILTAAAASASKPKPASNSQRSNTSNATSAKSPIATIESLDLPAVWTPAQHEKFRSHMRDTLTKVREESVEMWSFLWRLRRGMASTVDSESRRITRSMEETVALSDSGGGGALEPWEL